MTDLPAREGLATVLAMWKDNPPGAWEGGAVVAACHWVRDHGAALLAEVERLQQELAESQEWQVVFDTGRVEALDRAEAAEQVAREAVRLLDASACPNRCDGDCALCVETQTFLAHHGARTGESNE